MELTGRIKKALKHAKEQKDIVAGTSHERRFANIVTHLEKALVMSKEIERIENE